MNDSFYVKMLLNAIDVYMTENNITQVDLCDRIMKGEKLEPTKLLGLKSKVNKLLTGVSLRKDTFNLVCKYLEIKEIRVF